MGWVSGDVICEPDEAGQVGPRRPWEGYIFDMAVPPGFRRRGIGRRLLQEALERYRDQGCVRVEPSCGSPTAGRFYRACGAGLVVAHEHSADGLTGSFEWTFGRGAGAPGGAGTMP